MFRRAILNVCHKIARNAIKEAYYGETYFFLALFRERDRVFSLFKLLLHVRDDKYRKFSLISIFLFLSHLGNATRHQLIRA